MGSRWNDLRAYVAECVRILYWAYFKPYTFRRWLREIDPDLNLEENPFRFRDRFDENPRLRRYAGQVWWLAAVVPLLTTLFIGLAYTLLTTTSLDWTGSGYFFLGW